MRSDGSAATAAEFRCRVAERIGCGARRLALSQPAASALNVNRIETIGVTDWVRLSTPNLSASLSELVAVTEGPMNLSAAGIGIAPTPPPGSTLQDYWVVGIV